jgi:hypothetical protein
MFTTGTAANHNDLFDQFVDWIVNTVGWTLLDYSGASSPTASATENKDAILRAPGATAGNEYFIYMSTEYNVGAGYYGWRMRAAADYEPDVDVSSQLLVSPAVYFNTWQNSIDYWFFGDERHAKIVAKVNTSYISMYIGLFLPFALPSEYPKPFYISGNYPSLNSYDVSNSRNRFIADPGQGCAYYLKRDQTDWRAVGNHFDATSTVAFTTAEVDMIWPHRTPRAPATTDPASNARSWNNNGLSTLRPLASGETPQFLCHLFSYTERKMLGTLDGVYAIAGFGKTSEQQITIGSPSRTFHVFQNIFRTTGRDFMSIEEV